MIKKENNNKARDRKKGSVPHRKWMCVLSVFVMALLVPAVLVGCASGQDEVVMALASQQDDMAETCAADENMTDVSVSGAAEDVQPDADAEPQQVYIYVCGAVELPGVYRLKQGSRLYEAVELAGGLTSAADESCLNMARQIADGEQVVILTQEEAQARKEAGTYQYPSGEEAQEASLGDGLVNINTATAAELTSVSGIGEGRAQAIIAYREKHGSFASIEDIKKVDGIKDGLFSKIKDKIKT